MKNKSLKIHTSILYALPLLLLMTLPVKSQKKVEHSLQLTCGTVQRFQFESKFIAGRNVDIWTPDGYSPENKYAVLYMHDGQMLYDGASSWNKNSWQVGCTIQRLIDIGQIENVIVVGIWNSEKRHPEYFPQKALKYIPEGQRGELLQYMPDGLLADNYLKFIVKELKPFVDQTFSTLKDPSHTFIAGSSMGGLISLYGLCEYPNVFGGAGCLSTHWIGTLENNQYIPEALNKYLETALPAPGKHKIYFDYGTIGLDSNYPTHQALIDTTMKEKNYNKTNWITLEFQGDDHNEKYWAARFYYPLLFLLGGCK